MMCAGGRVAEHKKAWLQTGAKLFVLNEQGLCKLRTRCASRAQVEC